MIISINLQIRFRLITVITVIIYYLKIIYYYTLYQVILIDILRHKY